MDRFEHKLWDEGYQRVCGLDEAGRGPLAGSVFAAAVILKPYDIIEGVKDSKQLTHQMRLKLAETIKKRALAYAVAQVDAREIDRINILEASRLAMLKAIQALKEKPDFILTDAMKLPTCAVEVLDIIKGDQISCSIASASILAKTSRDHYMEEMAKTYPGYGFERHKGYPTPMHVQQIKSLGVCPIHRTSFKPIRDLINRQLHLEWEDHDD
jgi:ribonuclease HII